MVLPGQQPATITMWHSQAPGTRLPPNSQKARPRQTTAGRTQSRPALSMQPIGSGQPANHAIPQHQGNLGSGQRPTPIQQPVIQHAASTHNVISTSTPSGPSVPNVVANPYFATHLTPSSFKPRKWQPGFRFFVRIEVHPSSHFLEFFQSRRCSRSTRGPGGDSKFSFNNFHLTFPVIELEPASVHLCPAYQSIDASRCCCIQSARAAHSPWCFGFFFILPVGKR